MTFNEAIECLMKGQRVRSVLWHPTYFIELGKDKYGIDCINETCNDTDRKMRWDTKTTVDYHPSFSLKDVLSDWELYEGELQPLAVQ